MPFPQEAVRDLARRLESYGEDVYAKKNLAYQHIEIDGQVIVEGEHKERTEERKTWIRHLKPEGRTVLDLGCNLGVYAIEAARLGARMATGIDIQPNVIAAANQLREFFGLANCRFEAVDLTAAKARDAVEPRDIVLAFAVYDHLVDRHKEVQPWDRENNYLDITEWLARIAGRDLIAEFHNKQLPWAHFYERVLVEHGFEIVERKTTHIERPVFFCRRGDLAHDQLRVDGRVFTRVQSWRKRHRRLYLAEQAGSRFLIKRYGERDILANRHPRQEFGIQSAFADVPDVLQPVCCDERRIVFPWLDARPVAVIDEQPLETADVSSPVTRFRIVEAMARVLAAYHARREHLFRQFAADIPDAYREQVRTGRRLLVDLCRSNILVTRDGEVRFTDFEPSKPPLAERIAAEMQEFSAAELPRGWRRWFR